MGRSAAWRGGRPGARPVALTSAAHAGRVALIWPARAGRRSTGGRGSRGVCGARSSGALHARTTAGASIGGRMGKAAADQTADRVVVGMDPHKRSVTIEVMVGDETVLGGGRFATTVEGYRAMRAYVARWADRIWAIEGCAGIGGHVATRLLGDGEQVVDVPPKLSARARVFTTGQGRKTDATDAHSVGLVGTRVAGLRPVIDDQQLAVLRILVDRRLFPGRRPHQDGVPAAPPTARADPRRREEGPLGSSGQGAAGQGPPTRRR